MMSLPRDTGVCIMYLRRREEKRTLLIRFPGISTTAERGALVRNL